MTHAFEGNHFFVVRMTAERPDEGIAAAVTTALPDYHLLRPNVVAIPFILDHHGAGLLPTKRVANLSKDARGYLKNLEVPEPDANSESSRLLWMHALAICFSPQYLSEHRDGILADWPRIPFPKDKVTLESSAALGERIAALLDPDKPVAGVSDGKIEHTLMPLGVLTRADGKPLTASDLSLSAGWGYRTKTGAVMPGSGRIKEHAAYNSMDAGSIGHEEIKSLGPPIDVMLNDLAMWRAVPRNVWEYRIGGYQVVKKWLSYRERSVLDRPLTKEEAREVTVMVRRLATIVLMSDELNTNYATSRDNAFAWAM